MQLARDATGAASRRSWGRALLWLAIASCLPAEDLPEPSRSEPPTAPSDDAALFEHGTESDSDGELLHPSRGGAGVPPAVHWAPCVEQLPDEFEEAATSPDEKITVFSDEDPIKELDLVNPGGPYPLPYLCIHHEGMKPRVLLTGRYSPDYGQSLGSFGAFLFSPDGKTLYFESIVGYRPKAHSVDLRTGEERFIGYGGVTKVLTKGPFKGMLLLSNVNSLCVVSPLGEKVRWLPYDQDEREGILGETVPENSER